MFNVYAYFIIKVQRDFKHIQTSVGIFKMSVFALI